MQLNSIWFGFLRLFPFDPLNPYFNVFRPCSARFAHQSHRRSGWHQQM
jgi:hypothetical protein